MYPSVLLCAAVTVDLRKIVTTRFTVATTQLYGCYSFKSMICVMIVVLVQELIEPGEPAREDYVTSVDTQITVGWYLINFRRHLH